MPKWHREMWVGAFQQAGAFPPGSVHKSRRTYRDLMVPDLHREPWHLFDLRIHAEGRPSSRVEDAIEVPVRRGARHSLCHRGRLGCGQHSRRRGQACVRRRLRETWNGGLSRVRGRGEACRICFPKMLLTLILTQVRTSTLSN